VGLAGIVFALFTAGYILGVWTACLVFKQPQRAYEEGESLSLKTPQVVLARQPAGRHG
jgi:hypothetical protein